MTAEHLNACICQLHRDIEYWEARYNHADRALRATGMTADVFRGENRRDHAEAEAKLKSLRGVAVEMQLRLRVICNQTALDIGDDAPYSGEEVAL